MLSTHPMRQMPLWRDANQLLLLVEQAVRHFPRYHKYTLGTDLRRQAMNVCRLIARAYHDREGRRPLVQRLNGEVDDLKIALQLAKELAVFRNFKEFESIVTLAVSVGKQSGGWKQRLPGSTAGTGA